MTIQSILESLQKAQRADGAFPGASITSVSIAPSAAIFGSVLIGSLLAELSDVYSVAREMNTRVVAYLKTQEKADGSYAYWKYGSSASRHLPYPPDLDDTSLAVTARIGAKDFDGSALAKFIKLLVKSESSEGGPYNTWIVDTQDVRWKDVDIGVNANIAYALDRLGVHLPNLQSLFDKAILASDYSSRYYHLPLMVLFFISRAYSGAYRDAAVRYIYASQKQNGTCGSCVETACALCALSNFGVSLAPYEQAITFLISELDEPMAFEALYTERKHEQNITQYANRSVVKCLTALALRRFEQSKLPTLEAKSA